MNISCVICSDLFLPTSEIHSTTCGHMFHLPCLMNWLERSKSCPQCRNKVTEKSLHRVFFNLANVDVGPADVGSLVNQVENLQFKITLEKKNKKENQEKIRTLESMNRGLREEVANLENKEKVHESAIHALKDQITYFKSRAKETDRLSAEIVRLKNSMKDMDNVNVAINGTRDQVDEILRNQHNIESLALLAATLKKALLDAEKHKRDSDSNLKRAKNDASRYKRECCSLESQVADLRRQLQTLKTKYEKEKQYIKQKIAEKRLYSDATIDITSDVSLTSNDGSVVCLDSPSTKQSTSSNTSLPMPERVQQILNSDSPYLPLKTNATSMEHSSLLNGKPQLGSGTSFSSYTIFKTNSSNKGDKKPSRNDVYYNGLGGSAKEDLYPSPKPVQTGLKRSRSNTTVSARKFKKLSAFPTKK
ncbi:TRAF interacting protein no poles [Leptinotarsa decemlineata]|uniref:TRAF interacting protein no poles n=1 Tax=Leptinotarsa decemlineata TaxID=7539 RepID=UPI003D3064E7